MEKYTMFLAWKNQYCKMTILPKAIYRFIAISIKLPRVFFTKEEKFFHNLCGNTKGPEQPKQS